VAAETPEQRELTLRAIVIGLVLSVVMGAANVYLGLKVGLTVSASIPAAVLGSLVLRLLGSRGRTGGTRLEANQIQTAASAGESLAAGVIFTLPALLLIGYWARFDMLATTVIAMTGGLLGILFMIPMRRVFVVESPELPYPEAVACAAVLETATDAGSDAAPDTGSDADATGPAASGAAWILQGGLLGFAIKWLTSGSQWIQGSLEAAWASGSGRVFFLGADLSPALIAVGFIVRLNVALLVALGGAIGWLICIPLLPEIRLLLSAIPGLDALATTSAATAAPTASAIDTAKAIWSSQIRYIGVGAMLVGGAASLFQVRSGLVRAVGELRRSAATEFMAPHERDLSPRVSIVLAALASCGIFGVYLHFTQSLPVTLITTALMLVLSFFFVAVASYIVGLVGNSNSPVSGMTITAVLLTALLLFQFGYTGTQGMVATLGVAAIVCCAACTSGDVCNDLKTGQLVGASPRRQQIMQILGVIVASLVMAPVLQALQTAFVIGSPELSAPQAALFANLVQGFFGDGSLPWDMVCFGILVGVAVLGIDGLLARGGSSFRAHLMPLAVGIYLPFELSLPLVIGGLIAQVYAPRSEPDPDTSLRRGVLFSSGVIAGEALTGVAIAIAISAGYTVPEHDFEAKAWVSLLAASCLVAAFVVGTRPKLATRR